MITIVVRDTPQPQGSKSAFALRKAGAFTGRAVVVEDNQKVRPWREAVRSEAQRAVEAAAEGTYPLEGPVIMAVTLTVPKPRSAPKTKVTYPGKKPDALKLLRSTEDALSGLVYVDDAQIVEYARFGKFYPLRGGVVMPLVSAQHMFAMAGTSCDILDSPGAVIRVAPVTEFIGYGWL